jgi:hypothetical protein
MEYRGYQEDLVIRLDKGDKIVESILTVAEKEGIALASVTGIGAVDEMSVGVFDLATSQYDHFDYNHNHEINCLTGNLTRKDGKPYLHLHITATGASGLVVGGHLFEATVSLTAEIMLHVIDGVVERRYDPVLGINRMAFEG